MRRRVSDPLEEPCLGLNPSITKRAFEREEEFPRRAFLHWFKIPARILSGSLNIFFRANPAPLKVDPQGRLSSLQRNNSIGQDEEQICIPQRAILATFCC